jgi:hypothetical protein
MIHRRSGPRPRYLNADVAFDLFPPARFPTVYIQLIEIQHGNGHSRIGTHGVVCCNIFRSQLKPAFPAFSRFGQTINRQAQIRQDIVIHNVVKENCVRIERFPTQNDAIVECFFVANGTSLFKTVMTTLEALVKNHCEATHNCEVLTI